MYVQNKNVKNFIYIYIYIWRREGKKTIRKMKYIYNLSRGGRRIFLVLFFLGFLNIFFLFF